MSKNKKNKKMTKKKWIVLTAIIAAAVLLAVFLVPSLFRPDASAMASIMQTATVETAPSIYAQQGKCRNHAAFSTLKTIKQPL